MKKITLVAGGTGDLGGRIIRALLVKGAEVRSVVRNESDSEKIVKLEKLGVRVFKVNMSSVKDVETACEGVSCVVSALAGLRNVIIDTQKVLLEAAISAGVPRFIPSDYSIDFTKFTKGENRNLDWRREFHTFLDSSRISATSIFNGPFADMLTGQMPLINFKRKVVLYWGRADHKIGFTTIDNTAEFTAEAALDPTSPRFLRIAGDLISARHLQSIASEVTGNKFRLIRIGGPALLNFFIHIARLINRGDKELYPAWQGMQYMHNMIDDRCTIDVLNNNRYTGIQWTPVREVLKVYLNEQRKIAK